MPQEGLSQAHEHRLLEGRTSHLKMRFEPNPLFDGLSDKLAALLQDTGRQMQGQRAPIVVKRYPQPPAPRFSSYLVNNKVMAGH